MDPRCLKDTPTDPSLDACVRSTDFRRAVRRATRVSCEIVSHQDDDTDLRVASDVSPFGMWIETPLPLHPGAELVVAFRPPRYEGRELLVFATVTRVVTGRLRRDRGPLGMGVEFCDLTADERAMIALCLEGIAPRLERRRWAA